MPRVVVTHAVEDVQRWLAGKAVRAAAIESGSGSNVTDHVAQVADMTHRVSRTAMSLTGRVEVSSGRDTPVGSVAKLMDVEPVLSSLESFNLATDGGGCTLFLLRELDHARNTFAFEHTDRVENHCRRLNRELSAELT